MNQINWQSLGDPKGPSALAVHCALGRGRDLGALARDLGLALQVPDLPGHGASPRWDGRGDYHTACTDAARAGLVAPAIVIGHSLGATIALRLAQECPDRVRALVLFEPVLFAAAQGTRELAAHKVQDAQFAAFMAAGDMDAAATGFLDLWGAGVPFAALPLADRQRIAGQMPLIAATGPALSDDAAGMLHTGALEKLRMPVLLLRGEISPPVTRAINTALAARIPQAQQAEIAGAGHMAPLTHTHAVATDIRRFLETL